MLQDMIPGTWVMESFEYRAGDGTAFYPYGKDAKGILMYDKNGFMSAIIARTDRPDLSVVDFSKISDDEKIELSKGFLSYSGRYEITPDRILHYVELSYFPNWIGTTLERFYAFEHDKLILSTPETGLRGKQFVGYITWKKA